MISILQTIEQYGLSIRQIPYSLTRLTKQGSKTISQAIVPEYAGYWMCQQVPHLSDKVYWNTKKHFLAPTLEASVRLFLESKPPLSPSLRIPGISSIIPMRGHPLGKVFFPKFLKR